MATAWPRAQHGGCGAKPRLSAGVGTGAALALTPEPPRDAALAAWPEHMSPLLQSCFLACFLINNLFLSFLTLMLIDV